jgi:mRNA-degrading endonuclease RelE of RelBE toxin-antitoxin system
VTLKVTPKPQKKFFSKTLLFKGYLFLPSRINLKSFIKKTKNNEKAVIRFRIGRFRCLWFCCLSLHPDADGG